ncbi:MAG: hypothetical protein VX265_08435 [Myxococcota bacterium]|nr:hypothetical protein [Myxococcota bacterium]
MGRETADHQVWQFEPVQVRVLADDFLSVSPHHPEDLRVERDGQHVVISGTYGFDTFREHRFVLLIDGQPRTFRRWSDIPDSFDNVIEFAPDSTHDLTFTFAFTRSGRRFIHRHWVHHVMAPWEDRLQELMTRETNGGWNARSHPHRRRRRVPLLGDGSPGRLP